MKNRELIKKLQKFCLDAEIGVIVHSCKEPFSISWGKSEGETKEACKNVYFYVDRLCQKESAKTAPEP